MKTQAKNYIPPFRYHGNLIAKVYYCTKYGIADNHKPHSSSKECQRRLAQGNAGTCYVHGAQYSPSLAGM